MFRFLVRLGKWLLNKFSISSLMGGVGFAGLLFIVGLGFTVSVLFPPDYRPAWIIWPMLGQLFLMISTICMLGKVDSYIVTEPSKSDYGFIGVMFAILTLITAGLEIPLLAITIPLCAMLSKLGNIYGWVKRKFEETDV